MSMSVCLSARISPEPHARSLPIFLCMLPMSVARSSSGMLTIGRIAYRRGGVIFPTKNALSAGKGDGSAQRGRSMLSTIALLSQTPAARLQRYCADFNVVWQMYVLHRVPSNYSLFSFVQTQYRVPFPTPNEHCNTSRFPSQPGLAVPSLVSPTCSGRV